MIEVHDEYQAVAEQVLTSGGYPLEEVLNQKARDGWELVAISPSGYWVFKRRAHGPKHEAIVGSALAAPPMAQLAPPRLITLPIDRDEAAPRLLGGCPDDENIGRARLGWGRVDVRARQVE